MKYLAQTSQLCILALLSFYAFAQGPSAKRAAPKEVEPVIAGNIKYTAPTDRMGYVVAIDISANKEIWSKKIFTIKYNRQLESDVQDIFIDKLNIKDNKLYIHDEGKRMYVMNLETQEVKRKFQIQLFNYRIVF
jgi:outer membrane protein assembly factor BamB